LKNAKIPLNPPLKKVEMLQNTSVKPPFSKGVWGIFASEGYINPAFHKKYIPNYKKKFAIK